MVKKSWKIISPKNVYFFLGKPVQSTGGILDIQCHALYYLCFPRNHSVNGAAIHQRLWQRRARRSSSDKMGKIKFHDFFHDLKKYFLGLWHLPGLPVVLVRYSFIAAGLRRYQCTILKFQISKILFLSYPIKAHCLYQCKKLPKITNNFTNYGHLCTVNILLL